MSSAVIALAILSALPGSTNSALLPRETISGTQSAAVPLPDASLPAPSRQPSTTVPVSLDLASFESGQAT